MSAGRSYVEPYLYRHIDSTPYTNITSNRNRGNIHPRFEGLDPKEALDLAKKYDWKKMSNLAKKI